MPTVQVLLGDSERMMCDDMVTMVVVPFFFDLSTGIMDMNVFRLVFVGVSTSSALSV